MSQPGSIQGQLNEAREHLAAARALNLELQGQYDRLLHRCRYAEGVVRDLHETVARVGAALERVK